MIEPGERKKIAIAVLAMASHQDFALIEETEEIYRDIPQGQLMVLPGKELGAHGRGARDDAAPR